MTEVQEQVSGALQNVLNWLRGLFTTPQEQREQPISAVQAQLEAIGGEDEEEDTRPAQRLASGQMGIFVHCSSCGTLHELETVCHKCGAPLCSDTQNCRLLRYDPTLGAQAVFCPDCAAG